MLELAEVVFRWGWAPSLVTQYHVFSPEIRYMQSTLKGLSQLCAYIQHVKQRERGQGFEREGGMGGAGERKGNGGKWRHYILISKNVGALALARVLSLVLGTWTFLLNFLCPQNFHGQHADVNKGTMTALAEAATKSKAGNVCTWYTLGRKPAVE